MPDCSHLGQIRDVVPTDERGCTDCLKSGGQWMHLRMCLTCGHVGCCDSSPNHHASLHAAATSHPLASSFEPGEDWTWCFVDEVAMEIADIPHPHRLPYPDEPGAA